MTAHADEAALTALFTQLGAPEPQAWAESQVREGIPQLARYLFLRRAWRGVLAHGDASWIQDQLATQPEAPGGEVVGALKRLLAVGASEDDLSAVVRVMQWRLLFDLCYALDDPGELEPSVADVAWGLFEVDAANQPKAHIGGLHESVLETDPTGREMRG